ncbi:hypothetical protein HCUR_00719 [Holospora curviuscula]|uniref:Uncharacterized protein n=1 Tax=Holospora curviuscula TaxID=1082868 RepID=A0A2S5R9D9_9PROT|nr:hypothetical protein HCUR_00719 [Holospora curviuscula]
MRIFLSPSYRYAKHEKGYERGSSQVYEEKSTQFLYIQCVFTIKKALLR